MKWAKRLKIDTFKKRQKIIKKRGKKEENGVNK